MKNLFILLAFSVLIFSSCDKESPIDKPIVDIEPKIELLKDNVTLQDLQVGQKSYFITYESTCENMESEFKYTGDTLIWSVELHDGKKVFVEDYSDFSPWKINYPEFEPIVYTVEEIDNGLLLVERWNSNLFFFYGNDTMRLKYPKEVNLTQSHCMISTPDSIFTGDQIGWIDEFKIGDMAVKEKLVVSCVPLFNVDAYLIYSDNHLYASHIVSTSEFNGDINQTIRGFELLK